MQTSSTFTLINPHTGALAFRAVELEHSIKPDVVQRLNYYSLIMITQGTGDFVIDRQTRPFKALDLLSAVPGVPSRNEIYCTLRILNRPKRSKFPFFRLFGFLPDVIACEINMLPS